MYSVVALVCSERRREKWETMIATAPSGTNRKVPGPDQMKTYLARGLTQQQIADEWAKDTGVRVTRNAITMAMKRYKLDAAKPLPRYEDLLPWHVRIEHAKNYNARMLRAEGRIRRLSKAKQKKDPDYERVESWKRKLDSLGAVVLYDPDTPAGFYLTPRLRSDDDLIRRPV